VFGPAPEPGYEELVLRHPSLDFATTHIYEGAIDYPRDALAPAELMGRWVRYALARVTPGRPFMDTEHGPIHLFNDHKKTLPEPFDNEYERHLMWAHLASGGAGSGMRWPARHPHLLTFGMRRALRSLAAFAQRVDWRHFTPVDALPDLEVGGQNLIPFACRDERQAVIWLLTDTRQPGPAALQKNVPLALRGLRPGGYCVETWDTAAGRRLECLNSQVGGKRELRVILPAVEGDLALAVHPCGSIPENEAAGLP
jgi:mannan endo-1,4-beta-mannosidase